LQKVAGVVGTYGKMTVGVIVHPDDTGTWQEREKLANRRAEAVRVQLLGLLKVFLGERIEQELRSVPYKRAKA